MSWLVVVVAEGLAHKELLAEVAVQVVLEPELDCLLPQVRTTPLLLALVVLLGNQQVVLPVLAAQTDQTPHSQQLLQPEGGGAVKEMIRLLIETQDRVVPGEVQEA